jgi:hypothetical protein
MDGMDIPKQTLTYNVYHERDVGRQMKRVTNEAGTG